jgi:hypothetical protein
LVVPAPSGGGGAGYGFNDYSHLSRSAPTAPVKAPCCRVCGPDITAPLQAVVAKAKRFFNSLDFHDQFRACVSDRIGPYPPDFFYDWDIDALGPIVDRRGAAIGGGRGWIGVPPYAGKCAVGQKCDLTVSVDKKCFDAGSVNYVIFGVMTSLCEFTWWEVLAAIEVYKNLDGGSSNTDASVGWAGAGFDGWPSFVPSPPANKGICPTTCSVPYIGPPFLFNWTPFGYK